MNDTCPDCDSDDVDRRLEEDALVYHCGNCGWSAVGPSPFHIGVWSVRIHQALAPIDILQSLMTDPDAVPFLKPRVKGLSYLANPLLISTDNAASDEYFRGEMDIAHQVYLRQLIVLAATYIELILTDFFRCLFRAHPLRMNQVLPPHDKKSAAIPLNEIVEALSKDELLTRLAARAANVKGNGEIDKIVERLTTDCRVPLHRPLVEDLTSLKVMRNRIVHEDPDEQITVEQVHNYFGMILYLLYVLGQVADHYAVPYWDDVGFVDEFADTLSKAKTVEGEKEA
jgi:hypothetical protein